MIFKILKLIIFILLIWYLSEFLANSEGETSVNWMGWGIQIPTDRFVLILIIFSILIIFIDRIWLALLNFPKAAFRRYEVTNNIKVEQKLVKAFLLASHGEFESAAKEAFLVAKNTKDKNLGKLLSAHLDVKVFTKLVEISPMPTPSASPTTSSVNPANKPKNIITDGCFNKCFMRRVFSMRLVLYCSAF